MNHPSTEAGQALERAMLVEIDVEGSSSSGADARELVGSAGRRDDPKGLAGLADLPDQPQPDIAAARNQHAWLPQSSRQRGHSPVAR
jgi:hypothetical protein